MLLYVFVSAIISLGSSNWFLEPRRIVSYAVGLDISIKVSLVSVFKFHPSSKLIYMFLLPEGHKCET
jgi:hypothetical protein